MRVPLQSFLRHLELLQDTDYEISAAQERLQHMIVLLECSCVASVSFYIYFLFTLEVYGNLMNAGSRINGLVCVASVHLYIYFFSFDVKYGNLIITGKIMHWFSSGER